MAPLQPRVLLLDAEPMLQRTLSQVLQAEGFRVIAATSHEVLTLCADESIDLILLDLPDRSCPQACLALSL